MVKERFAFRPAPLPDETLSSWVGRTARGMHFRPYAFVHTYWQSKPPVMSRDLDSLTDSRILEGMAFGTGQTAAIAWGTTLASYEGLLFETYRPIGCHWILPVGVRNRDRTRPGQQFCPACLAEDSRPYFRRSWRTAAFSTCIEHRTILAERCHGCHSPVMHPRASAIHLCWRCRADLRACPVTPASEDALSFNWRATRAIETGWVTVGRYLVNYAPAFFAVARQVMKLITTGPRNAAFLKAAGQRYGIDDKPFSFGARRDIEFLDVRQRHRVHGLAARLLERWPHEFVETCHAAGVWHSWALREFSAPPFIYADAVLSHLQKGNYSPSLIEAQAAADFLRKTGSNVTHARMKALLGDSLAVAQYLRTVPRRQRMSPVSV